MGFFLHFRLAELVPHLGGGAYQQLWRMALWPIDHQPPESLELVLV